VNPSAPAQVVALVTHARDVRAVERRLFAERLRRHLAGRALIFETCHRVEAYAIGVEDAQWMALDVSLPTGGRVLVGEPAVRHVIKVAVGGDSVVAGEDQVLHQLRESVDAARSGGDLDTALERLMSLALRAGRRARSWHQGPRRSLADVALRSIERTRGPIQGRDILIVGAGRMGCLAARAAVTSGANVSLANRSLNGARALAVTTGARLEAFDPGVRISAFAGVVVALAGPWPISAETIGELRGSATVIVDLSVPAAVPEAAAEALGPRLVSADALALADEDPGEFRVGSVARIDALVNRTAAEFMEWLFSRNGRAAAETLMIRADRQREVELAALWRRLPNLEPEARDAIEGMTRHLARRLLREPLERLGRDTDGRDERAVRDIFAL
jgi:glutamyl-tRNA reductase